MYLLTYTARHHCCQHQVATWRPSASSSSASASSHVSLLFVFLFIYFTSHTDTVLGFEALPVHFIHAATVIIHIFTNTNFPPSCHGTGLRLFHFLWYTVVCLFMYLLVFSLNYFLTCLFTYSYSVIYLFSYFSTITSFFIYLNTCSLHYFIYLFIDVLFAHCTIHLFIITMAKRVNSRNTIFFCLLGIFYQFFPCVAEERIQAVLPSACLILSWQRVLRLFPYRLVTILSQRCCRKDTSLPILNTLFICLLTSLFLAAERIQFLVQGWPEGIWSEPAAVLTTTWNEDGERLVIDSYKKKNDVRVVEPCEI